jgi:propionaldehyde dehydrogenase
MSVDEARIQEIVSRVLERLGQPSYGSRAPVSSASAFPASTAPEPARTGRGLFEDLDEAVRAAAEAQRSLVELPLETRKGIVEAMRSAVRANARLISEAAVRETSMGRVEDKIQKNLIVGELTPGVEFLETWAVSGDHGLTIEEFAPWGVIGSLTPSTNPTETVINNGISMLAAGNAVVFGPHPSAEQVSCRCVEMLNDAITSAGGPPNVLVALQKPTIERAQQLMRHPGVRLLVVTGGGAVVQEAMKSGKRVIAAGPGNPPAVVDETADLEKAGRDIVLGASLDNNIICTDEKEVFVVDGAADALKKAMIAAGAVELGPREIAQLEKTILTENRGPRRHSVTEKRFIGRSPSVILREIGVSVPDETRVALCDVPPDHPFVWTELLMPVLPVARVRDVDEAIRWAVEAEHGFRHTASMHSRNIDKLSAMAKVVNTSIFVKNGPNYAGLGFGGEGYTSFTIAGPTGEGLTNCRTFSRRRRCVLVDHFRIV